MKKYNKYIIDKDYSGKTVWDYLRKKVKISKRNLNRLKNRGDILLNDEIIYKNKILFYGDIIELILSDEVSENVIPEPMSLDIVYEDDYIIAVNKPPGVPVHPNRRYTSSTIANGLVYYWNNKGHNIKVRPINRLDKDTSGILLFAKNSHIHYLIEKNQLIYTKEYKAIVEGCVLPIKGIIDEPISRESPYSIKRVIRPGGKHSMTSYSVLTQNINASLIEVQIHTGRTHQIRVHMSFINHPIMGDELYGGSRKLIQRQALHASRIAFIHPITKQDTRLSIDIPIDMIKACEELSLL